MVELRRLGMKRARQKIDRAKYGSMDWQTVVGDGDIGMGKYLGRRGGLVLTPRKIIRYRYQGWPIEGAQSSTESRLISAVGQSRHAE